MKNIVCLTIYIFLSTLSVFGAERYSAGEGHFDYRFTAGLTTDTLPVFYYIPDKFDREMMPVVIGFHGNDRNCSYWIETWKEYADKQGFMFFIPWFRHDDFPTRRYQEVGIKDAGGSILAPEFRTPALVDSLICHILRYSGTKQRKVTIYGHSAGGQFVHRFMLLNNSPYVKKAIIGNPGWFTFPDTGKNYSYGIGDLKEFDQTQLRDMLAKNVILQLAEGDTIRESFLRKTPEADSQGLNRLERGNNFFDCLKTIAEKNSWDFNWRRVYVPGVGHDAVAMSRHAAQNLLNDSVSIDMADCKISSNSDWLHRFDDEIGRLVSVSDNDTDTICDALFIGSSSIRLWPDLADSMAPLVVKNRGYGGAMLRDMMINYRRVMAHYRPKSIVIYCDNDICGWKEGDLAVQELFSLYKMFIEKIHSDYPMASIDFLSVKHSLSRKPLRESQEELNSLMKDFSINRQYLHYLDVSTVLLDDNGDIDDSLFMDDHLHLNERGYGLWNRILKPTLIKQCKKQS